MAVTGPTKVATCEEDAQYSMYKKVYAKPRQAEKLYHNQKQASRLNKWLAIGS